MGLDLAAQGDELAAVPAQEAALLFLRRGFADEAAGRGVAMHGAVADQAGERGGVAGVGLAPPGEGLGGKGQDLRARGPELPLEGPAEAADLQPEHAAPAPGAQGGEQLQHSRAGQRAQAHGLAEPALHGEAGAGFFEVGAEAEPGRRVRRLRGAFRALQALAERGKAVQDVVGLGAELVFFH